MGAVYLAQRADDEYQKQVAIKIVKRGMDTQAILRRFHNERQILANLDHPNIAKLLDGGTTEDGLPYFIMDYVEGLPIDVYCDSHKLPTLERLKLFDAVCSAVQYAHQHGIVHRDIKPTNILVTADGAPKLLDFGIAKLLHPELSSQTAESTATAQRPMTPHYASPEQVRAEEVMPASDVYSLGVLLYELLTGHRPYRFKSRAPQEIERIICEEEPERPSASIYRVEEVPGTDGETPIPITPELVSGTRDGEPKKLRRRLAGDLDNIVLMALRKEPARRYGSVEQFSKDIRRHVEGLPVIARKDTPWYRSAKLIKRNKVGVLAGAVISVLLLALIGVSVYRPPQRDPMLGSTIHSIAVSPLDNLSGDPEQEFFADGMTDELITHLAEIGALRVMPRSSVMRYKKERKSLPDIAEELHVNTLVGGSVSRSGSQVHISVKLLHATPAQSSWEKVFASDMGDVSALHNQIAREIAQQIKVVVTPQEQARLTSAQKVNPQAYEAYIHGGYFREKRRETEYWKAIGYFKQAIDIDPNYALAYTGLAHCYMLLGTFDTGARPPKDCFPQAKKAAEKALEINDALAEAHASLGYIKLVYDWDWAGAESEFRRAIELNSNYATAHHWYAIYFSTMGRVDQALAEINRARELEPLSIPINMAVGRHLLLARQYDQAIKQELKTLELDPNFPMARFRLGQVYVEKAMFGEAITEFQDALKLSGSNPRIIGALGHAYARSGQRRQAKKSIKELQKRSEHGYVSPSNFALIHIGLGDNDSAFDWLEQAFEERSSLLILLKVLPAFDSLRSDARYERLVRRVGFPP